MVVQAPTKAERFFWKHKKHAAPEYRAFCRAVCRPQKAPCPKGAIARRWEGASAVTTHEARGMVRSQGRRAPTFSASHGHRVAVVAMPAISLHGRNAGAARKPPLGRVHAGGGGA